MRRLCYISLLVALQLLLSAFVDEPSAYASTPNEPREERLEQGFERELLCAKEYNNDVWRSPRTVLRLPTLRLKPSSSATEQPTRSELSRTSLRSVARDT